MPALKFTDGPEPDSHFLFGDNLSAMAHIADTLGGLGSIDLCYIDPPYNTGRSFTGAHGQRAYSDRWDDDDRFLEFLRQRLIPLRGLLSARGSLYLHIDIRIGHYVKVLLDDVFGRDCFRSDITRIKCNPKNSRRRAYGNMKDVVYFYSRTPARSGRDQMIWNDFRLPLTEEQIAAQYPNVDANGRRYATVPIYGPGETKDGPSGQPWRGMLPPKGSHWSRPPAELDRLDAAGLIHWSATGNPRKIIYADDSPGNKLQDVLHYKDKGGRRDEYPTEKNLKLLELFVLQSSLPQSTVIDIFCGSGTTLVAAARHGRRFIGADQSPAALAACVRRLTREARRPFTVWAPEQQRLIGPADAGGLRATVDGAQLTIHAADGAQPAAIAAVALARQHHGTWICRPLAEGRGRWQLPADRHETHALVIDRQGAISVHGLPAS